MNALKPPKRTLWKGEFIVCESYLKQLKLKNKELSRSHWYFSLGKLFWALVFILLLLLFLLEKEDEQEAPTWVPPGSREVLALCYVMLQEGKACFGPPVGSLTPVSHPVGHRHGTLHILSVWLSGSLTTLLPSSRLLILCCHEWQGCKKDNSNCRWDLISPMSHWAPGLQVNSQQRSHGGLAFYSQGRKQSLLAAEETAPLGTNYSVTL